MILKLSLVKLVEYSNFKIDWKPKLLFKYLIMVIIFSFSITFNKPITF